MNEERRTSRPLSFIPIAEASAVLALVGAITYSLGLIALLMPIALGYTHDFSSAWYAVSLAPKTVVVGQGIRHLLGTPTLIVIGYLAGWGLYRYFDDIISQMQGYMGRLLKLSFLAVVIALIALGFWLTWRWLQTPNSLHPAGYILYGAIAGALVGKPFPKTAARNNDSNSPDMLEIRRQMKRTMIVGTSVWLFLLGFASIALLNEPPLPSVEIDGANVTEGKLLNHIDGFWYVFNEEGELVAIPDAEVKKVRVSSTE